jgi:hypothetical protein
VEAVCALEVAVNSMARKPGSALVISSEIRAVLESTTLEKMVDRLGLTATTNILLPLILPKEDAAGDLLALACRAISTRQNVVHNGQRSVDIPMFGKMIQAVRKLCEILNKHTAGADAISTKLK